MVLSINLAKVAVVAVVVLGSETAEVLGTKISVTRGTRAFGSAEQENGNNKLCLSNERAMPSLMIIIWGWQQRS